MITFTQWLITEAEFTDSDIKNHKVPDEVIRKMIDIEEKAHLPQMQVFRDYLEEHGWPENPINVSQLEDAIGCDGQVRFIIGDNWYIIACDEGGEVEIIDWASSTPSKKATKPRADAGSLVRVLGFLKSFGNKIFKASAREDTSFALLKKMVDMGLAEFIGRPTSHDWGATRMHEVKFKLKDR